MKNAFVSMILCIILGALIVGLSGCICIPPLGHLGCEQAGETTAEGHRRHIRNARVNQENLNSDLDRALLIDEPSKATETRID